MSSYYNYSKPNAGRLSSILLIDERIAIKVKNGNESILKVSSNPSLTEPKCMVKESKINFGYTIVSKPRSKSFVLKNMTRSICLFEIINTDCK